MKTLLCLVIFSFTLGCGADKVVTHSIVDPTKIKSVSKYNSCCGHPYPTSRSQKHYFIPVTALQGTEKQLEVRSPCDGQVTSLDSDQGGCKSGAVRGSQIKIGCFDNLTATIVIFHITPESKISTRSIVKAGDLLGHAHFNCPGEDATKGSFDVAYFSSGSTLDTVFNHMTDVAFESWKIRGYTSEQFSSTQANCSFEDVASCEADTVSFE